MNRDLMAHRENSKYFVGAFVLLHGLFCLSPQRALAQANVTGQWQTLPTTMPINPVHVALMHNGRVLIASGSGNVAGNSNFQAAVWDPQADTVTTQPVSWDMFCNGMIVLPDGRPLVMGGTLQYDPFHGETRTSAFDPSTGTFTDQQSMAHGRWYPTGTVLGDGRVMIFSGLSETGGTNSAVEFYTLGSGWSQQYGAPWTPPLYPRMHVLPNGKVFYSGSTTGSHLFDPATQTWMLNIASTNYGGTRTYGSSVLMPLTAANGYKPRVMIFGGGNPATNTTEIIDLSVANPKWVYGTPMSQPRIEMNATLLPNGQTLALGGSTNDEDANTASLNADLYDSVTGARSSASANVFPRLYHSNSLLLPDGTVWVVGGNPARGTYESHMEIYSPAYLFKADGSPATRPTITSVSPAVTGYAAPFQILTPDAANISSVVLMRAGSSTHAFDMDQRMIGLSFTTGSGVLNVTSPPNGNIAPPGYYLLFILNSSGVPSVAKFVQISASADEPPTGTITTPASDVSIPVGQAVSFSGTGADPDGTITGYSWTFPGGNPSTSTLANPGYVTFSTPGSYVVSLTVTDSSGLTDPTPPTRTITVTTIPPAAPSNLTATSASSSQINLSWTNNASNQTGFKVERSPDGTTFAQIATPGSSASTYSDTGLAPSTKYYYRVRATNSGGDSAYSNTASATTQTSGGPPPSVNFVQGNSATPTSQSPVSVPFLLAQTAGDLNVVAVGWFDTTTTITSVADSRGNVYSVAVGPTPFAGTGSQSIYYAKNIVGAPANGNTVTVTFSAVAPYPDVRILEYSGLDASSPLDVTAAVAGSGTTSNSGAAPTTNKNDLILGTNYVATTTSSAGVGFTGRMISPDGDIAEDEIVTATGSYGATASLSSGGWWIMQMVAFKAAGGPPPDTTAPTVPSNLTATAASSALINLSWTASTDPDSPAITYHVEHCQGSGCSNFTEIGTSSGTTFSDTNLAASTSYGYRVRAADPSNNLTNYSSAASATTLTPTDTTPPTTPSNLTATAASSGQISLSWTASADPDSPTVTYHVERCLGASCGNTPSNFAPVGTSTTATFGDTNLSPSSSYSYRVRATDPTGNASNYSNTASATTQNAPPAFVQGNYAVPSTPQTSVNIPFITAQGAGDLNVVIVGWFDTTTTVSSVMDTKGNPYTLAVGPTTMSGMGSLAIYYAKNIAGAVANANVVTVRFSGPVPYLDIRILEYNGIDTTSPLDVFRAATGTGSSSRSGPVTTINPSDLLIGANYVQTTTLSPGAGFTSRMITQPNGDIAEDEIATTTGSYTATANLSGTGGWIIQLAAFKAAGSGPPDTTPPSDPSGLTTTAASSGQISLSWTASTDPDSATITYHVERCLGASCGNTPSNFAPVGTSTTATFGDTNLSPSSSYSYRVRATDPTGNASNYSNTASATTLAGPPPPPVLVQSNYAVPTTSQSTVALTYALSQTTGNLNVVVVGWGDNTITVTSVTDTKGNGYTLAAGPTQSGVLSQSIYYAKNIASAGPNGNVVTVKFSAPAPWVDLRILEYRGLDTTNPVDAFSISSGSGSLSSSGPATTTNANDLLFGANFVMTVTTGPGTGYTQRILTNPNGDIVEDQAVSATGTYSATAPITNGQWIMQLVAFRAHP